MSLSIGGKGPKVTASISGKRMPGNNNNEAHAPHRGGLPPQRSPELFHTALTLAAGVLDHDKSKNHRDRNEELTHRLPMLPRISSPLEGEKLHFLARYSQ